MMVVEAGGGLIEANQFDQILKIDNTCRSAQRAIAKAEVDGNATIKALVMARATRALQDLLTPDLMQDIMALQGSPLGFRTDRDHAKDGPRGYPVATVRDVVIQALLRGFQVTGNQINIIGGNLYITKEGFEKRIQSLEAMNGLAMDFQVPDYQQQGRALVGCVARWVYDGQPAEMRCLKAIDGDYRIAVRVNAGMGDDAVLGKAKSKLLRKVFERVTGMAAAAIEDSETVDAVSVSTPAELPQVIESEVVEEPTTEPVVIPDQDEAVKAEGIPTDALAEIQSGLSAITTRQQLEGFFRFWEAKAKNREWTPGQRQTLIAHCRMKAAELAG